MWNKTCSLFVALAAATGVLAGPNCPPLGPVYEAPDNFDTSSAIKAAVANLTATLTAWDQNNSTGVRSDITSYSIEVFSTSKTHPSIFSWHHTAPSLHQHSTNATGVTKADADTVYRLGSLTKIFTVLTWLVQDGDDKWNDPITKYVPELAAAADRAKSDPVANVPWDEVTIGGLASQLSGAIRDYGLMSEVTQEINQTEAVSLGFPPLNSSDPMLPQCGEWPECNRTEFFNGLLRAYPSFPPFATPAYTNTGFQILSYALESIKGKSFQSMMQESVLDPLGLKHTYYQNAPAAEGIIPGNRSDAEWDYQLGDEDPAGNMYSSVGDLASLGRAIMSSSLIPPVVTRRWLKPAVMSSELIAGVGYPWGIRRVSVNYANGKRVVDAFNKAGRVGYYASLLVLLPDYNAGFAVLLAGEDIPGNSNFNLADVLGAQLVPALEAAAREQADATFAGTYVDTSSHNKNTTSSLKLTTQADRPGLGVENWVSNGTDMETIAVVLQAGYTPVSPSIRLYPAGLETVRADGSRRVAYKAVFEDLNLPARPYADNMFSTDCGTWVSFTGVVYGTQPLDQFVFELDAKGAVVSIENIALRSVMTKQK